MIYDKTASFPYPILTSGNKSYVNNTFDFKITKIRDIKENNISAYEFVYEYNIESGFIIDLINNNKAKLLIIFKAKDNKFFYVEPHENSIIIPKNRINIEDKITTQMQIMSRDDISFSNCLELNDFYSSIKKLIELPPYTILGYSNVEEMMDIDNNPLELFEYSIDPTMDEEFSIHIDSNSSVILLKFKDNKFLFNNINNRNDLLNMYFYAGLYKALTLFIVDNITSNSYFDEEILIEDLNTDNILYQKLIMLMRDKAIESIYYGNIDLIIFQISDGLISKFVKGIEEIYG